MELLAKILIYVSGILWAIELIPQITKTVKSKKVEDISPMFFTLCFTAYVLFLIGNIILKNWIVTIAHTLPFLLVIVMLILLLRYKK